MKSRILVVIAAVFMLTATTVQAQSIPIELKINPIGALFGDPDLSAEFLISDQFGIEPTLIVSTGNLSAGVDETSFKRRGLGGMVAGKYYFNPQQGGDRFNIGLYAKYKNNNYKLGETTEATSNRLAYGFMLGSKFVSQNNILFEFTFGMGRNTNLSSSGNATVIDAQFPLDFVGRIAVGYRFGGGDMVTTEAPSKKKKKKKKRRRR